jgi:hypothetical protein
MEMTVQLRSAYLLRQDNANLKPRPERSGVVPVSANRELAVAGSAKVH